MMLGSVRICLVLVPVLAGCGGATNDGPSDADAATAATDAAPPPAGEGACGSPPLRDDFSSDALDSARWRTVGFTGWTLELIDGRLSFTPGENHENTRTGLLLPRDPFALQNCATWVEVPRVLPDDIRGEVNFSLTASGEAAGLIRYSSGSLLLLVSGGDSVTLDYDAIAHRWWRFREASGVLVLETSPDGLSWTDHVSGPPAADLGASVPGLNVIETTLSGVFVAPLFDNVNVRP